MYSITVRNMSSNPDIQVTFRRVPNSIAKRVFNTATLAFKSVEAFDEETGEIVATFYRSSEWFIEEDSCGAIIDRINRIIVNEA